MRLTHDFCTAGARRLFRASSAFEKTSICAAVEEARTVGVDRRKLLKLVTQEPQVLKVVGLSPLHLYDANVQEKEGPSPQSAVS